MVLSGPFVKKGGGVEREVGLRKTYKCLGFFRALVRKKWLLRGNERPEIIHNKMQLLIN
jgi:hypothetical protein